MQHLVVDPNAESEYQPGGGVERIGQIKNASLVVAQSTLDATKQEQEERLVSRAS